MKKPLLMGAASLFLKQTVKYYTTSTFNLGSLEQREIPQTGSALQVFDHAHYFFKIFSLTIPTGVFNVMR